MRKGHARLRVGSQYVNFAYATPKELREILVQQESYPLRLGKTDQRTYWHRQNRLSGLVVDARMYETRSRSSTGG